MKYHDQFEWDRVKAAANRSKHRVTFEVAKAVLADDQADVFHVEQFDDAHSMEEDRQVTIASHPADRDIVLVISWTDRSRRGKQITRIIRRSVSPRPGSRSSMKRPSSRTGSSADDLARLKLTMGRRVDTSDIPEVTKLGPRLKRDASGRLEKKPLSPIREAILSALGRRRMTRYRLWKNAHALHPSLSQSAVYEYLRGERDIGVSSVEALMAAAGLTVSAKETKAEAKAKATKADRPGE